MASANGMDSNAGQPKSKTKKAGPALSRNQACRTCRSRKVKCDAAKPGCGACCRSANAQGRDPSAVVCEYDEEPALTTSSASRSARDVSSDEPVTKRSRISPPENSEKSIQDLQRQIADLQNQIKGTPAVNELPSNGNAYPQGDWLAQTAMSNPGLPLYAGMYSNAFTPAQTAATPVNLAGVFPEPRNFISHEAVWSTGVPSDTTLPTGTTLPSIFAAYNGQATDRGSSQSTRTSYPGSLANAFPFTSGQQPTGSAQASSDKYRPGQIQEVASPNGMLSHVVNGQSSTSQRSTSTSANPTPPLESGTAKSTSGPSPFGDTDLFSLWYPNWPESLPPPKIVFDLCELYFSKDVLGKQAVNQAKFLSDLALPPSHHAFPHVALIHAVCGTAIRFVENDSLGLAKETYWRSESSPSEYHVTLAKQLVEAAIVKGDKLLSVAQAIILLCFYAYSSARFVETWLLVATATRISAPLGLNHLEGHVDTIANGLYEVIDDRAFIRKMTQSGGKGPVTEEEKQEQAHIAWTAFMGDRAASACTGWASSLSEDDISTLLPKPVVEPGPVKQITPEEMECLSISSPTFFTSNDTPLVDACNLQYKSIVLLGRVCAFLRTAAWPVGSDLIRTARFLSKGGKPSLSDVSNSPEFKRLDALIVAFRLSFPKRYKNILGMQKGAVAETALITAHVVPHAATILLHEPFCVQADDVSMRRCLTSARAILGIIYLLWNNTSDISLLQPFITFTYATAGRTLVRELAFKREMDDELAVATISQEINVIISVLSAFADRSPLGMVVATSLRQLLDDPDSCHPRRNGGVPMKESCGVVCIVPETSEAAEPSNTSDSAGVQTPGELSSFSGLLWELEQPGVELEHSRTFKTLEEDLRAVLGPSFEQAMRGTAAS